VLITLLEFRKGTHFYVFDCALFFVAGILGCLFLALGGFTEHTTTQWNLNLLWAWPTHIAMAFILLFVKKKKWVLNYFLVTAISAAIMVIELETAAAEVFTCQYTHSGHDGYTCL
jgi:hypothetical protein